MTQPVVDRTSQETYDDLPEYFRAGDEETGWQLLHLATAFGHILNEVNEIVRDTEDGEPGLGVMFDPARAPAVLLPWVGQFSGVIIDEALPEDRQRELLSDAAGWRRGTRASIEAAARLLMTGGRNIIVDERWNGPYTLRVTTYGPETPDPAAVQAAIEALKPAGIVLTYVVASGASYGLLDSTYGTYAETDAAFGSYDDQTNWIP